MNRIPLELFKLAMTVETAIQSGWPAEIIEDLRAHRDELFAVRPIGPKVDLRALFEDAAITLGAVPEVYRVTYTPYEVAERRHVGGHVVSVPYTALHVEWDTAGGTKGLDYQASYETWGDSLAGFVALPDVAQIHEVDYVDGEPVGGGTRTTEDDFLRLVADASRRSLRIA